MNSRVLVRPRQSTWPEIAWLINHTVPGKTVDSPIHLDKRRDLSRPSRSYEVSPATCKRPLKRSGCS